MVLALAEPTLPPLIRGDELAAALDEETGPRIGRLLALIAEEQAAGTINDAAAAIAFARATELDD